MAGSMIVGITGKRLSGKSAVAGYLRKGYGFRVLCFTEDLLKPILEKRKEPVNRMSLIELGMEIRKKRGSRDALARLLARKISKGKYAIAGIRFPEEASFFRKKFGKDFILIAVEASEKTRFRRAGANMRFKDVISMRDFLEVEKLPTERVIPKTMKLADFSVGNDGARKGLEREIDRLMKDLGIA